jgi:diguanylate cyclase (GGDEF)-like protein
MCIPKWVSISLLRNSAGDVTNHIASFVDMSERKSAEEHISRLAHHDSLTGLFNRYSLHERLEQALLTAQREGNEVAVILIDMDRFKSINDTLGHQAGDAVLIEIAQRLQDTIRESDIIARFGGDEFIIALTGVESGHALLCINRQQNPASAWPTLRLPRQTAPLHAEHWFEHFSDGRQLRRDAAQARRHRHVCGQGAR